MFSVFRLCWLSAKWSLLVDLKVSHLQRSTAVGKLCVTVCVTVFVIICVTVWLFCDYLCDCFCVCLCDYLCDCVTACVTVCATIQYSLAQRGFDLTRLRINAWRKGNCLTLEEFTCTRINAGGTAQPRRKLLARATQAKQLSLWYWLAVPKSALTWPCFSPEEVSRAPFYPTHRGHSL